MLWTLCSAVILTLGRALTVYQGGSPNAYGAIQGASSAINGVITGAIFAGAIVLVFTRVRSGPPMLRQPGHWILFILAVQYLIYLPVIAWMLLVNYFKMFESSITFVYCSNFVFLPIAYSLAARSQHTRRWRVLFFVLAVVTLAQGLSFVAMMWSFDLPGFRASMSWITVSAEVSAWGSRLLAVVILATSFVELAAGDRRDWLHWTGIVTFVAITVAALLWTMGSWFFR